MAGLALVLGQALPVFASETETTEEETIPTRFDDILVFSNSSSDVINIVSSLIKANTGTCISMTPYYDRSDDVSDTTDANATPTPYVHALYHTPFSFKASLNNLLANRCYYGQLHFKWSLSWSFSINNWSRNASCIAYYSGSPGISVRFEDNYIYIDVDLDYIYSSESSYDITCYFVIESSYRTGNKSYAQNAITLSQTSTVLNVSTSSVSLSDIGYVYESNATPTELGQSNFLNQWTMIQNQNAMYLWASAFQQQQAIFQGNLISNLNLNHNVIHQDLQTIHHDLTDTNSPVADAQSEAADAQSEAAAAESAFNENADPEQISDDFDEAFDDSNNPMNSGELSNGLRFWWTLTNEWFASNDNEDANYPVYIQIFLNFLGRLW